MFEDDPKQAEVHTSALAPSSNILVFLIFIDIKKKTDLKYLMIYLENHTSLLVVSSKKYFFLVIKNTFSPSSLAFL